MTPPISRSTDAGTAPDSTATPSDASIPADATAPADAAAHTADASAQVPPSASSSAPVAAPQPNPLRFRINLEGGPTWMDLSNNAGLDHFGGYGRAEVGMEYRLNDTFFFQAGAGGTFGFLSRDLGSGVTSSLNYQGLFAQGRFGAGFLEGNLRLTGGIELGAAHVGAPECRDGMTCGALFTRNAQLLPIDTWTMMFGGEVGISTLQGALGLFARLRYLPGVNPAYNVVDGEHLNFGVSIPEVQFGVSVDLVAAYNLIFGAHGAAAAAPAHAETSPAATAETHPSESASHTPDATPPLQGLALIQDRRERATHSRAQVTSAAAQVTAARALYQSISGSSEAEMRSRRVAALEAMNQTANTIGTYFEIRRALEEAQAALPQVAAGDRAAAQRAIQEMTAWQGEARRQASQAYREGLQTVGTFNQLPNHGESVPFEILDPNPAPVRSRTPRPHSTSRSSAGTGTGPDTTHPGSSAPTATGADPTHPGTGSDPHSPPTHGGGSSGTPRPDAGTPTLIFPGTGGEPSDE